MHVYKRGKFWHYKFEFQGQRFRGTTNCTDERAARRVAKLERDRITLGEAPEESPLTLEEAAISWWNLRGHQMRSPETAADRLEQLRLLIDFKRPVSTIRTADIADAVAIRARTPNRKGKMLPKPGTVNRDVIGTIRPILNHARVVLEADVRAIDWSSVRQKEPPLRVREFNDNELGAIFGELKPHWLELTLILARYGLRLKEAWFPLENFDTESGRIRLTDRKAGDDHTITLLEDDRRMLAARAARARAAGFSHLWFRETRRGLKPVSPGGYQKAMYAAYEAVGIKDARPAHDFRHHAGTRTLRASGNLKVVQRLLGHASIQSSARYARAAESDVSAALEAAGPLLNARPGHKNGHKRGGGVVKPLKKRRN